MTTVTDPLTIAFMAIGANATMEAAQKDPILNEKLEAALDGLGWEGFLHEVVELAPLIDVPGDVLAAAGGIEGCFSYEVAEPFGVGLANLMIEGRTVGYGPNPDAAAALAVLLLAAVTIDNDVN